LRESRNFSSSVPQTLSIFHQKTYIIASTTSGISPLVTCNAGVPLEVVMRILGHADVKSTLVYARLKRETLKDAMKVFDVK